MEIGYAVVTCQRTPVDERTHAEVYAEAIDLAVEAEQLGFDSIWVSEHHFWDDAWMPSPLPLAAAIAARTSRIAIGTGVLLAPLYQPVRLAEDVATVDVISDGRLILGLGLGWQKHELPAYEIPPRSRVARLHRAVDVMQQAWAGEPLDGLDLRVAPEPARAGGPPIWIGATSEPGIRRAGEIATGFQASLVQFDGSPEAFREQVGWVKEELARHGREVDFTWSLVHPVVVSTDADAWPLVRDHWNYVCWKYEQAGLNQDAAVDQSGPAAGMPPPISPDRDAWLRQRAIVGTPAEVADQIRAFEDAADGPFHFLAWMYLPGMEPGLRRQQMRAFADEVLPRLTR